VTVGALNAHEALLSAGIDDGSVVARNVTSPAGRLE
jgi:hypothetical protein